MEITNIDIEIEEVSTDEDYKYHYFIVDAEYDYQPYEPEDRTIRGYSMGYPGCPAQVEGIYNIVATTGDNDQLQKFLEDKEWEKWITDKIEDAIWKSFNE